MKVLDARETARQLDTNGWIEIKGNPISKVGVFQYLGREIDQDSKMGLSPGEIYNVYRPAESLSDPETIESFKLLPWTDDHPSKLLGSPEDGRMPAENKGISGVIGQDVYFEYPYLKGNVKTFSEKMANKIESGKIELSPGYTAKYELQKGNYNGQEYVIVQKHLRGNHLALVHEGRTGPDLRVLDQKIKDEEAIVKEEMKNESAEANKDEGKGSGLTLEALAEQLSALVNIVNNFMNSADNKAADKKSMDEETAKKDDEKKGDKKEGAMDAAALRKSLLVEISHRDQLVKRLLPDTGVFDHAEMSLDEVAKYGIKKLQINCTPGHELSALNGYLSAKKSNINNVSTLDSYRKSIGETQIDGFLKSIHKGGK